MQVESRVPSVRTGLDRLVDAHLSLPSGVKFENGLRIAVLTNQSAVDSHGVHLLEHLHGRSLLPVLVLSPEHGIWGTHQDMEDVGADVDPVFGMKIVSLYGADVGSLDPDAALLTGVDVLIADMQDVGSRYYTFAATLVRCMRAAARARVRVVVLDRPNPIDGTHVEGNLVEPSLRSFVGDISVPQRHGLTMGELARAARDIERIDVDLEVIEMSGWNRSMPFVETGLPWVPPSPNMPTPATALVYPGMCLLEGTNVSEGRGTTSPFEIFGAPFIDSGQLGRAIEEEGAAQGALLTRTAFRPLFGKFSRAVCNGLRIHVTDPETFRPLAFGLSVIKWLHKLYAPAFRWRTDAYEFVSDRPAIDLLLGAQWVRPALEAGAPIPDVLARMEQEARPFLAQRADALLY